MGPTEYAVGKKRTFEPSFHTMKTHFFFLVGVFLHSILFAQTTPESGVSGIKGFEFNDEFRGNSAIRLMFYNVENLFDIVDDSLTQDESFTPEGDHHWNRFKYEEKLDHISKTVVAVGGWENVEVVGLCEVENRDVLEDLVHKTVLEPAKYEIIHRNSPDNRGIDVAMLYRPDKMKLDTAQFINVFLGEDQRPTREVLCATFTTPNEAKIHVFVNHWPSRYGGQLESDPKRKAAAASVRVVVDSLLQENPLANIVLMGDFNDYPDNESVHDVLRARSDSTFTTPNHLYNLMSTISNNRGTHKYQGTWGSLDQIIISRAVFKGTNKVQKLDTPLIFAAPFLLEEETKYPGEKPFRTYGALKYLGGYSDHLPVFIDLQLLK